MASVASYLHSRQYMAVDSADFIGELQAYLEAAGDSSAGEVAGMLRKWVYQKSVPRVEVYTAGAGGDEVGIRQVLLTSAASRCSNSAGVGDPAAPWHVPVQFASKLAHRRWYLLKTCHASAYIHSLEVSNLFGI
jgi:hypothetical protein